MDTLDSTGPMPPATVVPRQNNLFGFGHDKANDKVNQPTIQLPLQPPLLSAPPSPSLSPSQSGSIVTTASQQCQHMPQSPLFSIPPSRQYTMTPPALSTNQLQSSPARGRLPASPRVVSPAGSQIFERDVQDSCSGLPPTSPAIPSHIQTENHIPSVLDASSEAITDDHLDPERVEIITHPSHMPAAFGFAAPTDYSAGLATWAASANSTDDYSYPPPLDREDTGSIQGSLDEVRRLSFISFADVVLAEHTGGVGTGGAPGAGNREAGYVSGATTLSGRSPSPISSPTLGSSPPTSSRGSVKGFELSSGRKPGSPLLAAASPNFSLPFHLYPVLAGAGAELNVETMSQALRRTGSADLTFARSILASPIEGPSCRP